MSSREHDEKADTDIPLGTRISGTGMPGDGKGQIEIVGTASSNHPQSDDDNAEMLPLSTSGHGDEDVVELDER